MIVIGNPYIHFEKDKAKLICKVRIEEEEKEIFYEVEKEFASYLTNERADAFLVCILPFAIKNEMNVLSEAPISDRLLYQLNNILIPSLSKFRYNNINISVESLSDSIELPLGKATGTGLSSGVDSFDSIKNHSKLKSDKFNVNYATFLNVGSHGFGTSAEELYYERLELAKVAASKLGLELVHVNTNIAESLQYNFIEIHTFLSSSAILALQKLFKIYYYASGYPINEFQINENSSSAHFDLLTLNSVSTENTVFYSTGIEKTRLDKVKSISEYDKSYTLLNVCTRSIENCGECEKCIRTQLELYSIDRLKLYSAVFDIGKFYKKLDSHIGYILANSKKTYNKEIINKIKINKKISLFSYIHSVKFILYKVSKKIYRSIIASS